MLLLNSICKDYVSSDSAVHALKNVSIAFRKSEFVAVLGPSGCGKTTLLNVIGGLDRYDSGNLFIAGKSTHEYTDRDWDTYRNHSVGFVFQSYNLIPHQTVLSNVELALTLSGVSKEERRARAIAALERVGLGDQLKKKPNQMSGGQMQRVAIARALVNDPEIILADEPTGALDSVTSLQIMDILKEISRDKLIVMVTHNPEIAQSYASRIVTLKDGSITGDSMPFSFEEEQEETRALERERINASRSERNEKKKNKTSMSFFTALSLSLNNLMTKKGRTFLTSFAGSIGIIGIALILALSNGINLYIAKVQEDALSTSPLTIKSESYDMTALMTTFMGIDSGKGGDHENDAVYSNPILLQMMQAMNAGVKMNDLKSFKEYLDNNETVKDLVTDIRYDYEVQLSVYASDYENGIVRVNPSTLMNDLAAAMGMTGTDSATSLATEMYRLNVWEEMLGNTELVNTQYDVISGKMPESYNEIALLVDENNEISDLTLYTLGLLDSDELSGIIQEFMDKTVGQGSDTTDVTATWQRFEYGDLIGRTYKVVLPTSVYEKEGGEWVDKSGDEEFMKSCIDNGIELKIVGILRPNENATATSISGSVAYLEALTKYVIEEINQSEIVKEQLADPETDVFTGLKFGDPDEYKPTIEDLDGYAATLSKEEQVQYKIMKVLRGKLDYSEVEDDMYLLDEQTRSQYMMMLVMLGYAQDESISAYLDSLDDQQKTALTIGAAYLSGMEDEDLLATAAENPEFAEYLASVGKAASPATYKGNLKILKYTSPDTPSSVSIYAKDFKSKEKIVALIEEYNAMQDETGKLTYTDIVGALLSGLSTIVNFVSYALIAFVSISLVVSSIMIGIITYISVLERTKEIGILRSIGASKRDIARVFNAETLIVGFGAGVIGILGTLVLILPLNAIIYALGEVANIAKLPLLGAVILIIISMALTLVAGLIPSGMAAKKDPVEALRTE